MTNLPSLVAAARALREKRVTSVELIGAANDNYEQSEHALNAYKSWDADRALRHAQAVDTLLQDGIDLGPLMGLPVSVKDLYGVPGFLTYAGSLSPLPSEWEQPGSVMQALLRQMGIVMGKSHTVEFAFSGLGINNHWGTPVNPWSLQEHRLPGGSSSGAGVSLIQGSALLAFGSDTGGSIRIPASMTGQVGLKITYGRWGLDGIVPLSSSLDSPGIMCRTVLDVAYAFHALDPAVRGYGTSALPLQDACLQAAPLAGLRIGIPNSLDRNAMECGIADLFAQSLDVLASCGAVVADCKLPGLDEGMAVMEQGGLSASELRAFLLAHFPEKITDLDPIVQRRLQNAEKVTADEYLRRKTVLNKVAKKVLPVFANLDVLITPTLTISPPCLSDLVDTEYSYAVTMKTLASTVLANMFGWCAISLPMGLDCMGLPAGLQIMAPPMQEEKLLSVALAVEEALTASFAPRMHLDVVAKGLLQDIKTPS